MCIIRKQTKDILTYFSFLQIVLKTPPIITDTQLIYKPNRYSETFEVFECTTPDNKVRELATCACRGSSGQKPQCDLMTLAYQRLTPMLLTYGSLFLSGVYYCPSVLVCRHITTVHLLTRHCL
jgi:hypothetical protein